MNEHASPPLVDGYEVLELIGKGSMGSVWLARQLSMNRLVALKILHPEVITNKELLQRFVREARVSATLDHPNLIRVHDVVRVEHGWALVMEYVAGITLAEAQKKRGRIPENEVLNILLQSLEALEYLHSRGIAHRDVKPDNLMILDSGQLKLADLGLARRVDVQKTLTAIDEILGTPAYMAPEQMHNAHAAGKLCDYYSLGATAWHLLAGRPPYEAPSAVDLLMALEKGPPPELRQVCPDISSRMSRTIATFMHRNPASRPQSIEEAKRLVLEGPPARWPQASRWVALAIVLIGIGYAAFLDWDPPTDDPVSATPLNQTASPPEILAASEAGRDMLNRAMQLSDLRERIALLEAILREYPGTDLAIECEQSLEAAMDLWTREQRHEIEELIQQVDLAISGQRFDDARSSLELLRAYDPAPGWVAQHLPSMTQEMATKLKAARERFLQDALGSAERQANKGLLVESLEILRQAIQTLPGESRLEVRANETEFLIKREGEKLREDISDFISADLPRACKQRQFAAILKKAEDWSYHPLAESQRRQIEDLKILSRELIRHEEMIENQLEFKLGEKIQIPGQSGNLQGTVVRHKQSIGLKLTDKVILPVLEAADPGFLAQVPLEVSPTSDDYFRAALYARYVAQDDTLGDDLEKRHLELAGDKARNLELPWVRGQRTR
ncbi:MAG: serine/threonine-protein kinase [Planctomycetota bacterium]